MNNDYQFLATLLPTITLVLGTLFGTVLNPYFQSKFERNKEIREAEHNLKQQRYKTILTLMLVVLDPANRLKDAQKYFPNIKSGKDLIKEIRDEMFNSILFANDAVIYSLADFIKNPTYSLFIETAAAMRSDLWKRKSKIDNAVMDIFTD